MPSPRSAAPALPSTTRRFLELGGLSALAFAAPSLTGLDTAYLTAAGARPLDVVIVTLLVALGPPLVLAGLELLAAAVSSRLVWPLHVVFVGMLLALLAVYALRRAGLSGRSAAALGIAMGAVGAVVYVRTAFGRALPVALAAAPLIFGLWFVLLSPASALVYETDGDYRLENARTRAPIVLVVVDELPTVSLLDGRGRLDRERYPGFAELAATSTWYREATTLHGETRWAVPAIFTGRRSPDDSYGLTLHHERNIFTLLGRNHPLNVSERYTRVCPQDLCPRADRRSRWRRIREVMRSIGILAGQRVLPGPLARRLPEIAQFEQIDATGQVQDFLEGVPGRGPPSVNVLHLLQPHGPWNRGPSGERYEPDLPANLRKRGLDILADDRWWTTQLRQRHLAQLQYTDRLLSRLSAGLRRRGIWDDAVVVVVADHGVSTQPGGRLREPTPANAHDILPVPLFVKAPGQTAGEVSRAPAQIIDVLPTIAALAGIRMPYALEGRPLSDLEPHARTTASCTGLHVPDMTVLLSDLRARVLRAARRNARTFGSGDPAAIMRVGPRPDLVGRRVAVDRLPTAGGLTAELDGGEGSIRISGRVDGVPNGRALPLAVVVDGSVAATTLTYTEGPGGAFTAMLPEAGRVRIVLIEKGGLRKLAGA